MANNRIAYGIANVVGSLHITSKISQDFDRDIGLYYNKNRVKKNDLVISAVARVIGKSTFRETIARLV